MKHKTGIEEYFIMKNNRRMQFGYTTGTCAAAAAKASAITLLTRETPSYVNIITPKGIELLLEPVDMVLGDNFASCGIVKDAGDDPDVTHGLTIVTRVEKIPRGIEIDGGMGVGRVTRKGLEQPVGNAAINSVPRTMIREVLEETIRETGYKGGLKATVSVPNGEIVAQKTFNPRLGIEGGISILGTSGIVEPMSERALIKSLEIEMRQKLVEGDGNIVITLGNYGRDYLGNLDLKDSVKCSNYVGEAIDLAVNLGAKGLLFVAHIGKFIKVAGGIMNTHSRNADSRAEIMASCGLRAGISRQAAMEILDTITTDDAIDILKREKYLEETMRIVCDRIGYYLNHRAMGSIRTEALIFSNANGYLGETKGFREYLEKISRGEERSNHGE